ncbi:4312_t:CDS:2, partial [Dentiscutata heterogama]
NVEVDYAVMRLQQMYTEEKNGTENDYIIAMRLQEMYNKERTRNMKKLLKGPIKNLKKKSLTTKIFSKAILMVLIMMTPPPYYPSQKAAKHPSVHLKYPQQFPHQFPQQFSPYQQQTTPNYQEMFPQFMNAQKFLSLNDFSKEIARPKATFHMDNRFFCTDPEVWNDDDERVDVEHNWKRSINTIDRLLVTITELSSTSTKAIENMKNYRNRIKYEIAKMTQDIANIQQVQDSLEAAQKALQKTGDQKNSYSIYTKTETITLDVDFRWKQDLELITRSLGSRDICTICNCEP